MVVVVGCAVLHCCMMHCAVLGNAVLCCVLLVYAMLCYTMPCCAVLWSAFVCWLSGSVQHGDNHGAGTMTRQFRQMAQGHKSTALHLLPSLT